MRITITTDGGFTGRGVGSATVESEGDDELRRILDACEPASWRREYAAPGADLVRYTLTAGAHSVTWSDGAGIPDDLRALVAAVWRHH